jgi:hypothetical protein
MPTPSVDVITGIVTNGPIREGEEFRWTCRKLGGKRCLNSGIPLGSFSRVCCQWNRNHDGRTIPAGLNFKFST